MSRPFFLRKGDRNAWGVRVVCGIAAAAGFGLFATPAWAKEKHLEQVRVLLMAEAAKCTTCHTAVSGKELNLYGKQLADLGRSESMADRMLKLEADPPVEAKGEAKKKALAAHDADGDGVPNWVEILAGTNPGDPNQAPVKQTVDKLEKVVSCTMCHVSVNGPGEGLAANPHNELGKTLATTVVPKKGEKRPVGTEAIREAAERVPILQRLVKIKNRKPRKGNATYWERLLLRVPPADESVQPDAKELAELKRRQAKEKHKSVKQEDKGLAHKAHPLDGFLLDAKSLLD